MIYFGIPLRSKASSSNWENVERIFNRTLNSICSQTSDQYRVFVACHDVPKLSIDIKNKVQFIQVDCPLPQDPHEQMLDKGWKVSAIGLAIRNYGGGVHHDGGFRRYSF